MRYELDLEAKPIGARAAYSRLPHGAACNCSRCAALEESEIEYAKLASEWKG